MIRQKAFEQTGFKMLKGGLHCHTTRSDGAVEPGEVIRMHAGNGYDFLALTDHRRYNYQTFAPETDVLIVPGMEMDRNISGSDGCHCFHTVCIGPEPAAGNGFVQDQRFDSGYVSDQAQYQSVLDMAHENGNLTFYCHPEWSHTPACEFDRLEGNFAMEIWNSGCAIENDFDTDAAGWDDLLKQGRRIFGVATDDGHARYQHCKGWVMVNSEKKLGSILAALNEGAFYSSCGPEIYDFCVEDGKAVVKCSSVSKIRFHSAYLSTKIIRDADGKLEQAEFVLPDFLKYIRVSVVDAQGRMAWTNPIFLTD